MLTYLFSFEGTRTKSLVNKTRMSQYESEQENSEKEVILLFVFAHILNSGNFVLEMLTLLKF